MCDRNLNGEHPSCISALLDGPGAEGHGFCEPCAMEIRRNFVDMASWKEAAADALNKIHDLVGQIHGPLSEHPHLGAIQAWCHKVTGDCVA